MPTCRRDEVFGRGLANHRACISRSSAIPFRPSQTQLERITIILPTLVETPSQQLPIGVYQTAASITMASIARSSLLRQAALARCAAPSVSSRGAFAQSNAMRAVAFHNSSKRSAILPPGPRKIHQYLMLEHLLTPCRDYSGWRYGLRQFHESWSRVANA